MRAVFFIQLILTFFNSTAQEKNEKFISERMEIILENSEISEDEYQELYEQLKEILTDPVDLNKASAEDLHNLGLNEIQIHSIISHRIRFERFISIYELQSIENLDLEIIRSILPFINIESSDDESSLKKIVKNGSSEISIITSADLEANRGYKENNYPGSPFRHGIRYNYSFPGKLSAGFSAEKDAGEYFLKQERKDGFDFYSYHINLKNYRKIKALCIGDYTVNSSLGLLLGGPQTGTKSSQINLLSGNSERLRSQKSFTESGQFRGIAIQLKKKKFNCTFFFSNKKIDGHIILDTVDNEFLISSLQYSGLHRTEKELLNRKSVKKTSFGTLLLYNFKKGKIGLNYVRSNSKAINSENRPGWKRGISLEYQYRYKNVISFGELASDMVKHGYLNGIIITLDKSTDIGFIYRKYESGLQLEYSNALSENSKNENEKGIYSLINFKINSRISANASVDIFRHNLPKYLTDASSSGHENQIVLEIKSFHSSIIRVRYFMENKESNYLPETAKSNYLLANKTNKYRIEIESQVSEELKLKSRIELIDDFSKNIKSQGIMAFQEISIHKKFRIDYRLTVFSTDQPIRIYATEKELPLQSSFPSYSGEGIRHSFLLNIKANRNFKMGIKYFTTVYSKSIITGSGNDQINGRTRSGIKFFASWK